MRIKDQTFSVVAILIAVLMGISDRVAAQTVEQASSWDSAVTVRPGRLYAGEEKITLENMSMYLSPDVCKTYKSGLDEYYSGTFFAALGGAELIGGAAMLAKFSQEAKDSTQPSSGYGPAISYAAMGVGLLTGGLGTFMIVRGSKKIARSGEMHNSSVSSSSETQWSLSSTGTGLSLTLRF